MSVGVPALDADHRCLFRVINMLQRSIADADTVPPVMEILETLDTYARTHFRREEQVMAAIGFPALDFHIAEHRGFARYVATLDRTARERPTPETAATLYEYLTGWLQHHILIQDMAFKPYVTDGAAADRVARSAAEPITAMAGAVC